MMHGGEHTSGLCGKARRRGTIACTVRNARPLNGRPVFALVDVDAVIKGEEGPARPRSKAFVDGPAGQTRSKGLDCIPDSNVSPVHPHGLARIHWQSRQDPPPY